MKLGIGGFCTTIVGSLNCAPVVTIQNFISEGGNLLTSINVGALSSFSGRGTGKCIYNKRKSASGAERSSLLQNIQCRTGEKTLLS